MISNFTDKLIEWYRDNARDLPWRGTVSAYAIWVSEIMLQQTRVETVIPYYQRWMDSYPTVAELAKASERDILNHWEGLGYYSRARNLHKAARIVMEDYGGELPDDPASLQNLPGIGRYTAAAIASLAFGRDEAVLDGNVRRVLSRIFNVQHLHRSAKAEATLWELAEANLIAGMAAEYNQALMELGALVCTPRSPSCHQCPVAYQCQAFALGIQEQLPVKAAKSYRPHHTVTAAIIEEQGRYMIAQRPADGLLGSLWEFPGGKQEPGESLPACLQREINEELGMHIKVGEPAGIYDHAYTHFSVTLHAFHCSSLNGTPQLTEHQDVRWVPASQLDRFPMGKIDRQIADYLNQLDTEEHHDPD